MADRTLKDTYNRHSRPIGNKTIAEIKPIGPYFFSISWSPLAHRAYTKIPESVSTLFSSAKTELETYVVIGIDSPSGLQSPTQEQDLRYARVAKQRFP